MIIVEKSTAVRVLLGIILSVAGGLAFVIAFPPYEIWLQKNKTIREG
ncbi:MAG: hypothetical protein SCJ97_10485 [Bacillota bacterium]|nr:hypothetical protein [Bacillota bacterium]